VLATLKKYILSTDLPRATQAFLRYYTRRAPFREYDSSWDYAEDPVTFWQLHFDDNNALSKLADRILQTLANSVPCERYFSALNLLYTKTRNALLPERVDKLLYIQINRRTLRRDPLIRVLEDEGEDDLWTDAREDATFVRPAHTTEALRGEDVPTEAFEDELV
jgi:hAT family C-terminal dimerisation region